MAKSRSKLKGSVDQNAHPKWLQKSKDGSSPKSFSGWMEREECSLGFGLVTFHVKSKVVRAGETAVANLALERLGSRVFSYVARELIRSRKAPLTALEMTFVWFFTCMNSLVSFQMRAFCVCFSTTWEIAKVDSSFL